MAGSASQNGQQYATFDYTFAGTFQTNAGEAPGPYSEKVTPTKLPKGATGSLVLFTPAAMAQGVDIVRPLSSACPELALIHRFAGHRRLGPDRPVQRAFACLHAEERSLQ